MASSTINNHFLVQPGSLALSAFRSTRIATGLSNGSQKCIQVRSFWIHLVHLVKPFPKGAIERDLLTALLHYDTPVPIHADPVYALAVEAVSSTNDEPSSESVAGSSVISVNGESHNLFYITPRKGTISPWSSKATSIAHTCGLSEYVRRIERGTAIVVTMGSGEVDSSRLDVLHDRMTQTIGRQMPDLQDIFGVSIPPAVEEINLTGGNAAESLSQANNEHRLALDEAEMKYLIDAYSNQLKRNPVDIELYMFAQVNSEHCRHKQFNAEWTIDGILKPKSLFQMIRNTYELNPSNVVSAYSDNSAVLEGQESAYYAPDPVTNVWTPIKEKVHYLAKVETHNHPTAVSPYPGAATGSGGEIRDEGATGRGSKPKAGLSGFTVSDLNIPGFEQPWERSVGKPSHIASSLDIMTEAPIGSAAFNNEFGRPCTTGYFRTLLTEVPTPDGSTELRGYHKPIMIAGGVGTVRPQHALKEPGLMTPGSKVIVLGGPAMLIGLGGGAASSSQASDGSAELDFASVQRGNAEVQRRAQEVINSCVSLGEFNPIQSIHDVGAGGLSNALPELVHDAGLGAKFELREIETADAGMSPLQVWCCEAQERYVLAIAADKVEAFTAIANRERCGFSIVGEATGDRGTDGSSLVLTDRNSAETGVETPIDLPMPVLFGKAPRIKRSVESRTLPLPPFDASLAQYETSLGDASVGYIISSAADRVLALPAVGSKNFLITIGDRTVGGITVRDQMVGKWQVPLADVSVTAIALEAGTDAGEAMAMGERPTLALISPAASARMAVAESLMNAAAADLFEGLSRVRLSANWMAASGHPGEGAALYEAVEAIGMDLCPKLGISIPVGKDSMSMKMSWKDGESSKEVTAPMSVVITAFAPVRNLAQVWTPVLASPDDVGDSVLLLVDLAVGHSTLGGSALAQVFGQVGNDCPDVRDANVIVDFFDGLEQIRQQPELVLAYHDRSDGGLFTTVAEMIFAGRCGVELDLTATIGSTGRANVASDAISALFTEELGAVFQVRAKDEANFRKCFATCGPPAGMVRRIGRVTAKDDFAIFSTGSTEIYRSSRAILQKRWASTSYQIQRRRDNPACADEEYAAIADNNDPGLRYRLSFDPTQKNLPVKSLLSPMIVSPPRVAILRDQGVNGHAEMAFAFSAARFEPVDVHMSDILSGRVSLADFTGLAACGGFSYGDVLGAGQGWAKSVLFHPEARAQFAAFFNRSDTFALGVCNGCQFMARLKELIPGASQWPTFERNESEQYEARVCMVAVDSPKTTSKSSSVFFDGMSGSALPIVVAHGEGRATFVSSSRDQGAAARELVDSGLVPVRYVDTASLEPTQRYPLNPNGSPGGIAGVQTSDGRVLAMMPHPERTVLKSVGSWIPRSDATAAVTVDISAGTFKEGVEAAKLLEKAEFGPWVKLFWNVRRWVG